MAIKTKERKSVRIDLTKWTTQAKRAELEGCTVNAICLRVFKGTIETMEVPELGLTLVKK